MEKLETVSMQLLHDLREGGAKKSAVLRIGKKCFMMGKPYPVYPIYWGNIFLVAFPRYRDAIKYRTWLWNHA